MEFGLLGPVEAQRDGRELPLGGRKQRALLALLLLHANEAVSRDRLIDGVWGERPPPTVVRTLDAYVSRLRKLLGDGRLSRRPAGYQLRVEPGELDLVRFQRLRAQGREQLARGEAAKAAATLRSALSLWRGAALADVLYEPFAAAEAAGLEQQRLAALEDCAEADLALGRAGDLVPELEVLVRQHPLRERLLYQLMLALYRAGRQAEALSAFQAGRRRLAEELGLEPDPQLQALERQILEQDPALNAPAVRSPTTLAWKPDRRTIVLGAVVAATVAASVAVVIILAARGADTSNISAAGSQLARLSFTSAAPVEGITVSSAPAALVAANRSVWLASPDVGTVSRVDVASGAVVDRIPVGGTPAALAAGAGAVWVTSVPGDRVTRIDPGTGTVTQTLPLGGARAAALAFGIGHLWVADLTDNSLLELDPRSGAVLRSVTLHLRPTALAIGARALWVADYGGNVVAEVDLHSGETIATVHVGNGPSAVAVGQGGVWVANALDSTVSKIDPVGGSVSATIPVGSGPNSIAIAATSVWVANQYSGTVSRIDPSRNAVVATARLAGSPTALAAGKRNIWVGIRALGQHRGGTLRLVASRPITIDPELQVDLLPLQSDGLTADGLVTYNHDPGRAGIQLVPDLAIDLPVPTDGGTTYSFRLRPGIHYSDGRLVEAGDFRRSVERLFHLRAPARLYFTDLVGAGACTRPRAAACELSQGIAANDASRTIAFHLRAPDPDFLSNLANRPLPPIPSGTPFHVRRFTPIAATGPYKIAGASTHEIRYVRNPFFREWSHAAQPDGNPDQIITRFGLSPAQEVRAIENGSADWSADPIPRRLLPTLRRRFPGRLHTFSIPTTDYLQLNTRLPPFDDIRVRQALNLAIDRSELVRLYGGPGLASPTCQILPPGIPGYRPYCPYTRNARPGGSWTAPDFPRAQRLVAASGTRGTLITVWGWTDDPTTGVVDYVARSLRGLGYRARVRLVPHAFFDHRHARLLRRVQLLPGAWGDTPYGFFANLFSCGGPFNHGWFCDPLIEHENLHARLLNAMNTRAAAGIWAKIDRQLVDEAAVVPLINGHGIDFVSARVRNYQFHPYSGLIADQLWLR